METKHKTHVRARALLAGHVSLQQLLVKHDQQCPARAWYDPHSCDTTDRAADEPRPRSPFVRKHFIRLRTSAGPDRPRHRGVRLKNFSMECMFRLGGGSRRLSHTRKGTPTFNVHTPKS